MQSSGQNVNMAQCKLITLIDVISYWGEKIDLDGFARRWHCVLPLF